MATTKTARKATTLTVKHPLRSLLDATYEHSALYISGRGQKAHVYTITELPEQYGKIGCWQLEITCNATRYWDKFRYQTLQALQNDNPQVPCDRKVWQTDIENMRFCI
jgi:hypothetical protein